MTKEELVTLAAAEAELSKRQVAAALGAIQDAIAEALARGEQVRLAGFGAFEVRQRGARKGRDFRGNVVEIPAAKRVVFRPFAALRRSV